MNINCTCYFFLCNAQEHVLSSAESHSRLQHFSQDSIFCEFAPLVSMSVNFCQFHSFNVLIFFLRFLWGAGTAAQRSCGAPSLEAFKARLDGVLGSLSWWGQPCPRQGLGGRGLWGPFQPKPFCDSVSLRLPGQSLECCTHPPPRSFRRSHWSSHLPAPRVSPQVCRAECGSVNLTDCSHTEPLSWVSPFALSKVTLTPSAHYKEPKEAAWPTGTG